ncbi:hypothetical protein NM208_g8055 [Fusarium decemcellulare]|uniref:Uncharacterized protein n=1 Tax=Fusarium decemcellulare TaxID=57161 RepID=A0ACC1S6Q1_9HYPO|nr:hypothetical protein NM208_g8055 [Fusarium decemcellulare]
MAQLKHSKSELITAIHAGMISEAWNSGSHYIVAWRNGLLSDIRGHQLEPCTTPIEHILDETLCINGRNYAFIRNSPRGEVFWGLGGFSADKLKSFGLSREQVIASSEWRQNEAGTWIDRSYDTTTKMMQSLVGSPPPDGSSLAQFNLAVCNLDDVGGELRTDQGACVSQIGCLASVAVLNCQHLVMNGVPFPYKNNRFD